MTRVMVTARFDDAEPFGAALAIEWRLRDGDEHGCSREGARLRRGAGADRRRRGVGARTLAGRELGASVLLQLLAPRLPAARPWNTVAGQLVGLAAGFAAVYALGAAGAPGMASGEPVTWIRVAAAALAIALTALGQRLARALNPAGGSIALLVALGKIPATREGAWLIFVGLLMVSIVGEAARFTLLRIEREEE